MEQNEMLEAILNKLASIEAQTNKIPTIESRLDAIESRLDVMQENIEILKDEAQITRHTGNLLLKWAENADRTAVNVGLYGDNIKD